MAGVTTETTSSSREWRRPPRLSEEIARDIADAIAQGQLAPGDFLPAEHSLSARYGASRSATREALRLLNARGLIESIHGRGSRVTPRHRWQLLDQFMQQLRQIDGLHRSLVELRRILEVEVAGLAAQRATEENTAALREVVQKHRDAISVPEEAIEYDFRFHKLLAEASGNVLLPQMIESVGELVRANSLIAAGHSGAAVERAVEEHLDIISRVSARDAAGARSAMELHLASVEGESHSALSASTVDGGASQNGLHV